jgi:formate/nitrite transporter FocA (FNT family)
VKETRQRHADGRGGSPVTTDRKVERIREDEEFVPVIVKRTDETRRHPDDILEVAIEEGVEQLERGPLSLFLSAVGAGLILGFTAMSVAVVSAATVGADDTMARIAVALVYPLGFVVCLMSGTELFTEHTATAVYPVLDRRSGFLRLLRLWLLVGLGNLLGTLISAGLLSVAEEIVSAREGYVSVARHLVEASPTPLVASAILAGWLMALGAWLILATPQTVSQIVSIYIVTFLIGLGGLHHSIAGAAEMFAALLLSSEFTSFQAMRFIAIAMCGNLIGGSLFVAALNYGHIRHSRAAS